MAYTDMTTEFDYKDLATWQNLDKLAENDGYFKTAAVAVSGAWTFSDNITIVQAKKIYLHDGTADWLYSNTNFTFKLGLNSIDRYSWEQTAYYPTGDGIIDLGINTLNDWETIYYHNFDQHSGRDGKENIERVNIASADYNLLPDFKKYNRKNKPGKTEYGSIAEDCPPECISYDNQGKIVIRTNALISYLCGVIKMMGKQIDQIETRIQ